MSMTASTSEKAMGVPVIDETILDEAKRLVAGDRREAYGPIRKSFEGPATMWSVILGTEVKPQQVAQCMIALKMCRELNRPKRDNRVDICGYAHLLNCLEEDGEE